MIQSHAPLPHDGRTDRSGQDTSTGDLTLLTFEPRLHRGIITSGGPIAGFGIGAVTLEVVPEPPERALPLGRG